MSRRQLQFRNKPSFWNQPGRLDSVHKRYYFADVTPNVIPNLLSTQDNTQIRNMENSSHDNAVKIANELGKTRLTIFVAPTKTKEMEQVSQIAVHGSGAGGMESNHSKYNLTSPPGPFDADVDEKMFYQGVPIDQQFTNRYAAATAMEGYGVEDLNKQRTQTLLKNPIQVDTVRLADLLGKDSLGKDSLGKEAAAKDSIKRPAEDNEINKNPKVSKISQNKLPDKETSSYSYITYP